MHRSVGQKTFAHGVWTGLIAALLTAGAVHVSLERYEAARAQEAQEQLHEAAAEFQRHAEEFQKLTEALQEAERQAGPESRQPSSLSQHTQP